MKRALKMGMLLLGALLLTAPVFAHGGGGYGMGPGMMGGGYGMGPGMMGGGYGMGPGMMMGGGMGMGPGMMMGGGMGMGPGMMMGGGMDPLWMHPELAQLPAEKQEQLRKLHYSAMQSMITKRADVQVKALALAETMRSFPLNQKAAREQRAELDKSRQEMFELALGMMTQVQQIVGKELWERMHNPQPFGGMPGQGMGPGMMGPGQGMGPGMMGPQQPR